MTKNILCLLKLENQKRYYRLWFWGSLFKDQLLKFINKLRIKKFVNVQSNSINLGFNLFTKYKNAEIYV